MNSRKTAIAMLTVTAILLLLAVVFVPTPAPAQVSMKDRDYLVSTFPGPTGSDVLYIADTGSGMLAVIVYDPGAKMLQARAVRPIADAFQAP